MHFSIRISYPENNEYNWDEALEKYNDIGRVEVAFYSTELFLRNVKLEDVIETFQKNPLNVSSAHMTHIQRVESTLCQ